MDFGFSPEEERFAQEVRELFLQNKELVKKARQEYRSGVGFGPGVFGLMRKLGERGWLCPHWPEEYGGSGLSEMHHHIVMNEMDYFTGYGQQVGTGMAGPVIMRYGTERQKKKYLPPIARGEVEFALGYTEPQAGSDTSAIDLRAVEEDDHFILNGQKMFNTAPHFAKYHWLVARTAVVSPRHRGLSYFVVDLSLPGITIRPLWILGGSKGTSYRVNEVFYDDVKVPKECMIGEKNRGFYMLMEALAYERISLTGHRQWLLEELVDRVKELGKNDDPFIRQELAQLRIKLEIIKLIALKAIWMLENKIVPEIESATSKILRNDFLEKLAKVQIQMHGLYGLLNKDSKWAIDDGRAEWAYRSFPIDHMERGTPEIMRDIIAYRGLGLPRAR